MDSAATIKAFAYPQGADNTQRNFVLRGTIAISVGNYPSIGSPAVGGFILSWTKVSNSSISNSAGTTYSDIPSQFVGTSIDSVKGNVVKLPTQVIAYSAAATPSGYTYVIDNVNGLLHVSLAGVEVVVGAGTPAAVVADTIAFEAIFPLADV